MSDQDENQTPDNASDASNAEFQGSTSATPGQTTGPVGADVQPIDGDKPQEPAVPEGEPESSSSQTLYGSSVQPATVLVDGIEVQLGVAVAFAQQYSGLSVEAWNALPDAEREQWIATAIDTPKIETPAAPPAPVAEDLSAPAADPVADEPVVTDTTVPAAPVTPGAVVIVDGGAVGAAALGAGLVKSLRESLEQVKVVDVAGSQDGSLSEQVKAQLKDASVAGQLYIATVLEYMVEMAPRRPITDEAGSRAQIRLYRALLGILNNCGEDFPLVYSTLLELFDNFGSEGQVLYESSVFRFFQAMNLTSEERDTFRDLLNLVKVTASPQGRALALKQVSLSKTLRHRNITEPGRQRVFAFYGQ